jgi:hypothetical protein
MRVIGLEIKKIREVNTVAFLPTTGIFRIPESVYLAENKWSGRKDLNLRPPGPEPSALPAFFPGQCTDFLANGNGPSEIGIRTEIISNSDG